MTDVRQRSVFVEIFTFRSPLATGTLMKHSKNNTLAWPENSQGAILVEVEVTNKESHLLFHHE